MAITNKENLQSEPKVKTWEDVVANNVHNVFDQYVLVRNCVDCNKSILQKLEATLKISKLIELGYGGMVTEEENNDRKIKKYTPFYYGENGFVIECLYRSQDRVLCFHTQQQAEEFMSYPENVELVKQYFQI